MFKSKHALTVPAEIVALRDRAQEADARHSELEASYRASRDTSMEQRMLLAERAVLSLGLQGEERAQAELHGGRFRELRAAVALKERRDPLREAKIASAQQLARQARATWMGKLQEWATKATADKIAQQVWPSVVAMFNVLDEIDEQVDRLNTEARATASSPAEHQVRDALNALAEALGMDRRIQPSQARELAAMRSSAAERHAAEHEVRERDERIKDKLPSTQREKARSAANIQRFIKEPAAEARSDRNHKRELGLVGTRAYQRAVDEVDAEMEAERAAAEQARAAREVEGQ